MESSRLLKLSETTLGGSGVALHYANLIVIMEKMIKQPQLVGLNARDDLCSMLPATVRSSLSSRLKGVGFRANALHYAAFLKELKSKGVPVDSQSESGTPLIWDAGHDILDHNVDPNAETKDNVTPLLSAVAAGSMACLELLVKRFVLSNCLLKAGADPNKKDEDGNRPLEVASLRENIKIAETLFITLLYIPQLSPEAKGKGTEAKARGQDAFHIPIDAYTQVFNIKPTSKTYVHFVILSYLLLKRSLCWLRLGQVEHALSDAKVCRERKPDWPKECFREGAALRLLQRFDKAANVETRREASTTGSKYDGKTRN
ncbi:hypothetical protein Bca52824_053755 [Brassica carinata]|uniref:DUF668 domain-containing protein n=1 Tax=Brassica carinata TaxID=52824 RepID=A0A8X7R8M1_BRACI|nr:hypothetical protein Bca52824_053755 [Brassica carinata]